MLEKRKRPFSPASAKTQRPAPAITRRKMLLLQMFFCAKAKRQQKIFFARKRSDSSIADMTHDASALSAEVRIAKLFQLSTEELK
ncbi:hypothetical protein D1B33_11070 [Lysinibacillus yapensis]|uniref:Uncharacterized protein n=1 Tax=Ureibacillus yapensis TaxID=2304605 RepID=A0A396S6P9_9BACL|nr:hypothetical protein D1B33_11070 [Lysinibacillus yapensis]